MKKVIVYTMDWCPYCEAAKKLLKARAISFDEIRLGDEDIEWDELTQKSGMRTVPVIYADEELIGGYQELVSLDKKDRLQSLK